MKKWKHALKYQYIVTPIDGPYPESRRKSYSRGVIKSRIYTRVYSSQTSLYSGCTTATVQEYLFLAIKYIKNRNLSYSSRLVVGPTTI